MCLAIGTLNRVVCAGIAAASMTSIALGQTIPLPLDFERSTEIWTAKGQVRLWQDNAIYFGAQIPQPYGKPASGVWHRTDLKPFGVAADAKSAFLAGMLIITHGTTGETAVNTITARRVGDNSADCTKPIGQAIEAHVGGGVRSGLSFFVPLVNGEFEWCWLPSTGGSWPNNSSYGANMSILAWVR